MIILNKNNEEKVPPIFLEKVSIRIFTNHHNYYLSKIVEKVICKNSTSDFIELSKINNQGIIINQIKNIQMSQKLYSNFLYKFGNMFRGKKFDNFINILEICNQYLGLVFSMSLVIKKTASSNCNLRGMKMKMFGSLKKLLRNCLKFKFQRLMNT